MPYSRFNKFIQATLHSKYLLSLREAFIALLPYFVSSALALLIINSALFFNLINKSNGIYTVLFNGAALILSLFPLIVATSIGFFICKNYGQSGIIGAMLALLSFSLHGQYIISVNTSFELNPTGATPFAIIIPSISSLLLVLCMRLQPSFDSYLYRVSHFLSEKLRTILPFSAVFFSFYLFMPFLFAIGDMIASWITPDTTNTSVAWLTYQRMLITHGLWFLGIHGDNTFDMLLSPQFLSQPILPGISAKVFYDTFVLISGTGCFAGLILAALCLKRSGHERNIAKLSIPFTVFNFCEIIVFALPIFLNPIMLVPFILVPSINFILAYFVLSHGWVDVTNIEISWMTPALISGYKVSGGVSGVILQSCLIITSAFIYYPFLYWHNRQINFESAINKLTDKLKISEQLRSTGESVFIAHQRDIDYASKELNQVLNDISEGKLKLYYQPQICQISASVSGFEALLRLQKPSGNLVGPYFLDTLIKHDQTDIIDKWVIEQAQRDLAYFRKRDFFPILSINVNPKVMTDHVLINYLCKTFHQFPEQLKIEVVESGYLSDKNKVIKNILKLRASKIETVIDDFGTGYSSLSMLADLPIDIVKLDKSLLDNAQEESGADFYTYVVELLHKMDKHLVAEGVESQGQLEFVRGLQIETVQGWHYQKALPKQEIIPYQARFSSNSD
ncbi:EAL domain-containing protein [Pseudoalteromonas luteoviolacea]|uniref:EAL domain-containing protein n=1 Tax=Pseudoalteromonas luteoviolacea TaxID=43657 RepID=UPI001F1F27CF|nr:EAL domain-containing protein [Pseudoalteromonas luteoviolacea]MCF6441106.1 EAL domain-containing protein [Pseudoalteromonas luteoviolacea]